ncbi:hypothetical protein MG293_011000 [Ovis ammon polii]|uniref:C2 tensin-type domain-containing protein n=1 Tax=Ovis ammon polii TaxID=230172 RepID=A0AAD4U3E1_OVIAM|nr:hypothetical protein MG293_011000 [Ovis ammon polii]
MHPTAPQPELRPRRTASTKTASPAAFPRVNGQQHPLKYSPMQRASTGTQSSLDIVSEVLSCCDQSKVKKVTYPESFNESNKIKRIVYLIISSFTFRIFAILLIFVDMTLIIKDVIFLSGTVHSSLESRSISFAIASFFLMDISLRVFIEGIRPYFSDIFNSLDAAIIIVTLLVDIAYLFYDFTLGKIFPRLRIVLRPVRLVILIRVFHLAYQKRHLEMLTRRMDSLYYFGERRTDKSASSVGKGNGHDLKVQIIMQRKTVFFCSASRNCRVDNSEFYVFIQIFHDAETDRVIILLSNCPPLYDEVKVKFLSSSALPKYYDNCAFFFWFHMSFIQNNRLYLSRSELDNPHKIKAWKTYSQEFAVEVYFDDI